MTKPRLRFAPSPTGSLHVGGARTALYNYLYAKHHGGTFVLRLEDTDQERSTHESAESMMKDLSWLHLIADEGVMTDLQEKGDFGPYRQSERLAIYETYIKQLLDQGLAYYCFMTDAEVAQQKEQAKVAGVTYRPVSPDRDLDVQTALTRIQAGEQATVRFKVDDSQAAYHFCDLIRGDIQLPTQMVGDFVLVRSDGMPVYNFACVVDDAFMKITHVFRGEEHLSNTLKQMMLYQALGWTAPAFGHLSIILDEDRKKLSKRHLSASCGELRQQGFLPDAVNNALALLGWSHPEAKEIFTLDEMIKVFSIDRIHASSAAYDLDKLRWINTRYIHSLSVDELVTEIRPWVPEQWLEDPRWQEIVGLFQNELATFGEISEFFGYFSPDYTLDSQSIEFLKSQPDLSVIQSWLTFLEQASEVDSQTFKQQLKLIGEHTTRKGKSLFMPLRIAISGRMQGPELPKLVNLFSHEQLKQRALFCIESAQC